MSVAYKGYQRGGYWGKVGERFIELAVPYLNPQQLGLLSLYCRLISYNYHPLSPVFRYMPILGLTLSPKVLKCPLQQPTSSPPAILAATPVSLNAFPNLCPELRSDGPTSSEGPPAKVRRVRVGRIRRRDDMAGFWSGLGRTGRGFIFRFGSGGLRECVQGDVTLFNVN